MKIYKQDDSYTIIQGDNLYGMTRGYNKEGKYTVLQFKFLGKVNNKYCPAGRLYSRPSKKLIYIIQALIKNATHENENSYKTQC